MFHQDRRAIYLGSDLFPFVSKIFHEIYNVFLSSFIGAVKVFMNILLTNKGWLK